MKTTVLITGFGPFPGRGDKAAITDNPSARLVETLARDNPSAAFNLHARLLPTAWHDAGAVLQRALDEIRPDIVICFGVAARSDRIRLERVARNRVDPAHKDACGHKYRTGTVLPGAAATYPSALPLPAIHAALARAGVPCEASEDAGTYLCNYIFYQLLHHRAQAGSPAIAGFVHIPLPRDGGRLDAEGLAAAGRVIIAASVRHLPCPGS